jgi:ATP-dependent Zn protease
MTDVRSLGQEGVIGRALADVARLREGNRLRRMQRSLMFFGPLAIWLWWRQLSGNPVRLGWPALSSGWSEFIPHLLIVGLLGTVLLLPLLSAGKSPHVRYRPSEIETSFDDVVGMGNVMEEVVRTLNLFLGFKTFQDTMGGNPRRAVLFEGPPGTGKTYMAKAMAKEAGVPFLFVSASAFQSMYYGQTNRKVRTFFKALRKAAKAEGGAVGFIEEIDAIAAARSGMRFSPADGISRAGEVHRATEGVAGVVNELLIQLQSFDHPTKSQRLQGFFIDRINAFLPDHRLLSKPRAIPANVLVVGATNRADNLDPALLRPGRFDRSIYFGLPSRTGRREIIDYYLDRKAHTAELDADDRRGALAAMTSGYSPVMIEHLFDEGLVWALRDGRDAMSWTDVQQAKMTEELGLKQPVEYTDEELRRVAFHESGHAVVAHLLAPDRKLEVLSIIKRKDALGLLAHSDSEERFTHTSTQLRALIEVSLGGMVAEEIRFGQASTGPASDLAYATTMAAKMVGSFGMTGSLISYEAVESGPFGMGVVGKVLNNERAAKAVEALLQAAKERVRLLLEDNAHLLDALSSALIERNELVGHEITDTLAAAGEARPPRVRGVAARDLRSV